MPTPAPLAPATGKLPGRPPDANTRTLELEEPWADVPTSPQASQHANPDPFRSDAFRSDAFRSDTYEAIPTADHPLPGMTGSLPRPMTTGEHRLDDTATASRPFTPAARYDHGELDEEEGRGSNILPIAAVVLAAAVFLAVCAGIGGGGFLSWMATTRGGLIASTPEPVPALEPSEVVAAAEPSEPEAEAVAAAVPGGAPADADAARAEEEARLAREQEELAEKARVEREQMERAERERAEEDRLAQARVAAPPKPTPVPKPTPMPKPDPVASAPVPKPRPAPQPRIEAPPPLPADETWDAVAAVDPVGDAAASEFAIATTELDRWSEAAFDGELSPSALTRLAEVPKTDPGFTRARTLMYLDAKARNDATSRDQHLAAMMALPENRYNPILLVETAQLAIARKDWQQALKAAQTAEQHWARIPSELVFSRKTMIYEIEALAHTGLFYGSDSEDRDRLSQAIRGWERYRSHVQTKSRTDLVERADEHLEQLLEIQRRLE